MSYSWNSRSSPVHAASLVDPSLHSPEILQLIDIKLSRPVIEYVVDCIAETVDHAMGRPPAPSPHHAPFTSFTATVLARAEVTLPTVLVALVYIARARPHLSIALEQYARERVLLGALIAASKYTNDSTLKNVHWALCTGRFGKRDIGRIEREFLDVLDWELGVREADVVAHHEGLLRAAARGSAASPPRARRVHIVDRSPRAPVVPVLEPSSPLSSSDGSMSPRTPEHTDVEMDAAPTPAKTGGKSGVRDLLRAFPVPRPHHAHAYALHVGA